MNPLIKLWCLVCIFSVDVNEVSAEENCNDLGVHMYEELGCQPEFGQAQACPSHYSRCNYVRPKDKCTFQDTFYALRDVVDHSLTNCDINCVCRQRKVTTVPSFTCAVLDCPEHVGGSPLGKNCYRTYRLGQCCAVGQICPPFDGRAICIVDGITYREGEHFYPKKICVECVCQKGFKGEYIEPFCRKRSCAFELLHAERLEKNCAPVYYVVYDDDALCCPHDFICPITSQKIINKMSKTTLAKEMCKFGEYNLAIGDYFETSHLQYGKIRNLVCACSLPPYITCVGSY